MNQFVHPRLHAGYSLLDGIVPVPDMMAALEASSLCGSAEH